VLYNGFILLTVIEELLFLKSWKLRFSDTKIEFIVMVDKEMGIKIRENYKK
jgi:hypothetical protein